MQLIAILLARHLNDQTVIALKFRQPFVLWIRWLCIPRARVTNFGNHLILLIIIFVIYLLYCRKALSPRRVWSSRMSSPELRAMELWTRSVKPFLNARFPLLSPGFSFRIESTASVMIHFLYTSLGPDLSPEMQSGLRSSSSGRFQAHFLKNYLVLKWFTIT